MKRIFGSGRYANVTATLALVVALGGTSYAAVTLERNSVGAAQIKRSAVRASEVRSGAVRSSEVKNGTLRAEDFDADDLPAGPQGPTGAPGAAGVKGDKGDPGAPGSARAYGEVRVNLTTGDFELVPGTSKNVVGVTQGGGGNPAACIQLDPSIDAARALTVATGNLVNGETPAWDTQVLVSRPLTYCRDGAPNSVEILTTEVDSPGTASKRPFVFAVM